MRIYTESSGWTSWNRIDNTPDSIQSETLSRKQNADGSLQIELLIDQLYPVGKIELTFDENYIPPFQGKGATWKKITDIDADHAGRLLTVAGSSNFTIDAGAKAGSTRTMITLFLLMKCPSTITEFRTSQQFKEVAQMLE
ncbi:hypothetical protein AVI56_15800 (plasmid) [Piscirickettsia salmonis]|uniref:hypothetical protein n=1 Tax=Piscirickettsia salmonis TaxID=1238 RepID=UPI00094A7C15|nr:hypothetical protein [Piscirickettsia salmonis]APS71796.1 hypothetical protein AVI56_15800 [Piscirickettsia salmonis]